MDIAYFLQVNNHLCDIFSVTTLWITKTWGVCHN